MRTILDSFERVDGRTNQREIVRPSGSVTNAFLWDGTTICEWKNTASIEQEEGFWLNHIIWGAIGSPVTAHIRWSGSRWREYRLNDTLQLVPALCPYALSSTPVQGIVVTMSPYFVNSIAG